MHDHPAPLPAQRFRRRDDVLWRRVLDGIVVVPPERDVVTWLAGGAALTWDAVGEPRSVVELTALFPGSTVGDVAAVIEELLCLAVVEAHP